MTNSVGIYHELDPLEKYIDLEPDSNRIKFYRLPFEKTGQKTLQVLKELGREHRCDKLIFYVKDYEKSILQKDYNFYQEGFIAGFFQGDDAHIFTIYLEPKRHRPIDIQRQRKVMNIVYQDNQKYQERTLPNGYKMRRATVNDTHEMAQLYDTIFETYPTPMNNPQYIANVMQNDVYFTIIEYKGQVVSVASADFIPALNSAEMTDCATFQEHRKKGLLSHQFSYLIKLMKQMKVQTLFCYSRSVSLGMNLINARHGFTYGGRMVQNSNISGRLECMNIWFKDIRA